MLRGDRVLLRRGRAEDLDRLVEIRREPSVARWWGPADPGEIRDTFVGTETGLTVEVDGEVVGAIEVYEEPDPMYRHATVDIFLATRHHGRGLGPEALTVLARHLFERRGHHRVTVDPAADNGRAIRAYEGIGFRRVGVVREYERTADGSWRDGLLMDLLARELDPA